MSDTSIAARIHAARSAYIGLECQLFRAVGKIVGKDRLYCAHVENDSQYDNSIEVALVDGAKLTDAERAEIKGLGFSLVWNDERSSRGDERGDACEREGALRDTVRMVLVAIASDETTCGRLQEAEAQIMAKVSAVLDAKSAPASADREGGE